MPVGCYGDGSQSPDGGAKSFRWLNLHAYPAGTSFCSCKRKQNTLGGHPETPRTGTPARNGYAVPKRRLNGAYKGLWAHLPPSPPLPRSGGGSSYPNHCLPYSCARQVPTAMGVGEVDLYVLACYWLSPPPLRRGQGWWFAIPRSSAAGDKNASQTPYKHRLAHASGRHSRSERAFRCVGVSGFPRACFASFCTSKRKSPPDRRTN